MLKVFVAAGWHRSHRSRRCVPVESCQWY